MTNATPRATRRRLFCTGLGLASTVVLFARCGAPPRGPAPSDEPRPAATAPASAGPDWIVVAGERFPIGTRVVTWQEPDGYSAYLRGKHFDRNEPADGKQRYDVRGGLPARLAAHADRLSLAELSEVVHQFVVHFDVCGCSRQCFKVLQDVRGLSVHFMLDLDGTIYQTLDLRDKAWHATIANDFSVGVEIAHPGAYPQPMNAAMAVWYERDELGWKQKFPQWMTETGLPRDFVARPARPGIVTGEVQGKTWHMVDYTPQQYAALARLMAGLNRALPRIRLDAPREPDGDVIDHVLPAPELRAFDGIVGHFHVQKNKQDPGPAFQWDPVLRAARELRRDP
ncbi:MAG: N-acetylmuramoyl-L-alanine amidase [Planctomycetes bacterium]|nr:N-acetylmuramoyl-L-alanine amidase [Planctomycetota bacterium]